MTQSTYLEIRTAILLVSAFLGLQCIWLVSSELSRPNVIQLPTSAYAATVAARERDRASLAAAIGLFRGDLWGQSAFTYADLLFDQDSSPDVPLKLGRARDSLERALNDAPIQPAVWLLRTALGLRYPSLGFNVTEAIKISYYTGPSEDNLISLRLRLATLSGADGDLEIRPLIIRDLRFLWVHKQQGEIAEAYNTASPSGKRFMEKTLSEFDRSAPEWLRTVRKQSLPD